MHAMGYVPHPALPRGRAAVPVQPDGIKPTLYLRNVHVDMLISDVFAVGAAYTKAQQNV